MQGTRPLSRRASGGRGTSARPPTAHAHAGKREPKKCPAGRAGAQPIKGLGPPDGGGRSDEPTTRANHTGAGRRGPVWQKWDTVLPESGRCQAEARPRRSVVVVAWKQHVRVEHARGIER